MMRYAWKVGSIATIPSDLRSPSLLPRAWSWIETHVFNSRLKPLWWPQIQKRLVRIQNAFIKKPRTRAYKELFRAPGDRRQDAGDQPNPAGPRSGPVKIQVPFVAVQNLGHLNLHQFGPATCSRMRRHRRIASG